MTRMKHGATSQRSRTNQVRQAVQLEAKAERNRAYAVLNHSGQEIGVVIAPNPADALWQARQLQVVKDATRMDGGIWMLPTDRI